MLRFQLDTGVCKFGKTCRFPHVKGGSQQKFQNKANSAQILEQYMINTDYDYALKLQEFRKNMDKKYEKKFEKKFAHFRKKDKMKPYKKKLEEQNQKFATRDKANLAEEEVSEERAEVAKEVQNKEEEASNSDGSDLSTSDSEEEDQ